jgi:hypothetical protein
MCQHSVAYKRLSEQRSTSCKIDICNISVTLPQQRSVHGHEAGMTAVTPQYYCLRSAYTRLASVLLLLPLLLVLQLDCIAKLRTNHAANDLSRHIP